MNTLVPVFLLILLVLPGCNSGTNNPADINDTELNIHIDNGLCPSSQTIALDAIEIINQLRATGRQCGSDFYPAAAPVAWNELLGNVAKSHSNDMATYNFFDHSGSDGLTPGQRLNNAGYEWKTYGENISAGSTSIQMTIEGLIDSPDHCTNIMNPAFTEMGMACSYNEASDYNIYWTQVFATQK